MPTPAHLPRPHASPGYTIACAFLILFGADPSVKRNDGKTAADLARDKGHICPLKIIESKPEELAAVREFVLHGNVERLSLHMAVIS